MTNLHVDRSRIMQAFKGRDTGWTRIEATCAGPPVTPLHRPALDRSSEVYRSNFCAGL